MIFPKQFYLDRVPLTIIEALALFKKSCALENSRFGLDKNISAAIVVACEKILSGDLNNQFQLSMYQTISGEHTNMKINEVIANLATEHLEGITGTKIPVHPIDHVNKNQRLDQTFTIGKELIFL